MCPVYAEKRIEARTKLAVPLCSPTRPQQAGQHKEVRDLGLKVSALTKYFETLFKSTTGECQEQWDGGPRQLDRPVTGDEVERATAYLRNNRTMGPDEMEGEAAT